MTLVERVELTSAQASITFSNIPQDGTDLLLVISARSSRTSVYVDDIRLYFNGSNSGLSTRYLDGNGASAGAGTIASGFIGAVPSNASTANTFGNLAVYIPNYTSSNSKSYSADVVMENNATNSYLEITSGLWTGTSAINSITLYPLTGPNFTQDSSATLYKITKGSDGTTTVA